ncbi:MAG: nucleotide exchange factor GrpE [Paludibacteraceae bacterium]|nr:nucleotide exchange factor GrpE [Paludibacteraceae bacterium]
MAKKNKEQEEKMTAATELNQEQNPSEGTETQTEEPTPTREEQLDAQVEALKKQVSELEDIKLRQMAEFDNFRRRTNREKLELMATAGEGIFTDMLPLIDDLERAMQMLDKYEDINAMKEGVQMIYRKFLGFLEQNKVTAIETEGKDFSTDEHEAITTFAAGEDKKGKIIDCTQKGYKLGEKVIRFAKVVVGE